MVSNLGRLVRLGRGAAVALVVGAGVPGVAQACIAPASLPTPQEREAQLRRGQAAAWASAVLIYEAEIAEVFTVLGGPESREGYRMGTYVRVRPVRVLKGEGAPAELLFAYGPGPECTFDPSYSPRSRSVGGRIVFYSATSTVEAPADVFYTMPVDAVVDPDTRSALATPGPSPAP